MTLYFDSCDFLSRRVFRAASRWTAAAALVLAGPTAAAQQPVPQGPQFRVTTGPSGSERNPSVAVAADGAFVVALEGPGPDLIPDIYARRYAASGEPVGGVFRVNTYQTGDQTRPSVAVAADGAFVVAWQSPGQDGDNYGVYAQRYAASGAPVGGEFRVNTFTMNSQFSPSVAMDADGDFVVTWTSSGQDGDASGVYAQRYAASGAPVGGEFRVNTFTMNSQFSPSVAMDADGDFVVTWTSDAQDGDSLGVYAQRFTASGVPVGGEFKVNTFATGGPVGGSGSSVAVDADGDFVVAWEGREGGNAFDVYARRFAASGAPFGPEFRVNTATVGVQSAVSVSSAADGAFVVVWQSMGGEFEGTAILTHARRYAPATVASEPAAASGLALAVVPNPAATGAVVRYEVPAPGPVRLAVSDVLGREVAVLWDGEQAAGEHHAALDAGRLAPGVYIVRLTAGASSVVRRVTVVR